MIIEKYGSIDEIMEKLQTKQKTGISPNDVERRKKAFGPNFFPPPHIKSLYELVMENFEDKINLMLLAACIVSLIIGYINEGFPEGMIEGTSIAFALLIIVVVNSGNNWISERRLAKLVKLSNQQDVAVYRDSDKTVTIDGHSLIAVSVNGNILLVGQLNKLSESSLRDPVVSWVDHHNNQEGKSNGGSFDHALWESLVDVADDQRYDTGSEEHQVNLVFEVLHDQLIERLDVRWREEVRPKCLLSSFDVIRADTSLLFGLELFHDLINAPVLFDDHLGANDSVCFTDLVMIVKITDQRKLLWCVFKVSSLSLFRADERLV